jgi:hypothetical protein
MMMNDIVDVNKDWQLSSRDFNNYVDLKYDEPDAIHHLVDSDGDIIDDTAEVTKYIVRNYDYEDSINAEKGKGIKVLKPEYLDSFVKEFKSLL